MDTFDPKYYTSSDSGYSDERIIITPGGIGPVIPPIVWGGWVWGPGGWFWNGGPGIRPPMPNWRPPMGPRPPFGPGPRPPMGGPRPPMGGPRPPMINNRPPFGRPPVINRPPMGGRPPGFRDSQPASPSGQQMEPKRYFVNSNGEMFEV